MSPPHPRLHELFRELFDQAVAKRVRHRQNFGEDVVERFHVGVPVLVQPGRYFAFGQVGFAVLKNLAIASTFLVQRASSVANLSWLPVRAAVMSSTAIVMCSLSR